MILSKMILIIGYIELIPVFMIGSLIDGKPHIRVLIDSFGEELTKTFNKDMKNGI